MKLLINEPPLQVLPSAVMAFGLTEAIILQQLHYFLIQKGNGVEIDGHKWVFNTYEQWQEMFPFWSTDTIKRAMLRMEDQGVIIAIQPEQFNRRKHYRINYEKFTQTIEAKHPIDGAVLPPSHGAVLPSSVGATSPIPSTKTSQTKTTTKKSTRSKASGNGQMSLSGVQDETKGTNLAKVFGKAYGDQYLQRFHRPYEFKKKDYVACAELVKLAPLQELAALIDKCWDSPNAFYRNCASDLMLFRHKFNSLVAAFVNLAPPARQTQPLDWTDQPDYGSPGCQPEQLIRDPNDFSQ